MAESFSRNILAEELRKKIKLRLSLKQEINRRIYDEIRQNCSTIHYVYILYEALPVYGKNTMQTS